MPLLCESSIMATPDQGGWNRRQFLGATAGLVAGCACTGEAPADERPKVNNPRATSGDRVEPNWEERLIVTVGPKKADLCGTTEKVLQAAVDYVARLGGGTVHVLP